MEGVVLQLGLEHDAFGDVPAVEQQAVAVPADGGLDVQPLAAAGADPALHPGRGHGGARVAVGGEPHPGEVAADLGEHPVHVLGVDEVQQVAADEFLRVAPVDAERGRGDVGEHAVGAGDHDDVTGALHQGAEVRLLVGEFLGQRQVVEQHHALPEDQCQPDGAGGRGHHAVQLAPAEGVVEDAGGADRGGRVRGERAEGGGHPAARQAAGRGVLAQRAAPARRPGRPGQQQAAGEPAGVQQFARAVAAAQLRGGEQGVAQHGDGERQHRGVHRRPVAVPAAEAQPDDQADQQDVQHRVGQVEGQAQRGAVLAGRDPAQCQAPAEGEQRARDQPAVEQQAEPAGRRARALGEHQDAGDGERGEQQEGVLGERVLRQRGAHDQLVPAPGAVAHGDHERGEAEQQPGRAGVAADGAAVHQAGQRGRDGCRGQAEVAHEDGELAGSPADRGASGVGQAECTQGEAGQRAALPDPAQRAAPGGRGRVDGGRVGGRCARAPGVGQHRFGGAHSASPPPARGLAPRTRATGRVPLGRTRWPGAPSGRWPRGWATFWSPHRTDAPKTDPTPIPSLNDTPTQLRVMAQGWGNAPDSDGSARLAAARGRGLTRRAREHAAAPAPYRARPRRGRSGPGGGAGFNGLTGRGSTA